MVRLVWFPGYMDCERRKYTWEIRGKRGRSQCFGLKESTCIYGTTYGNTAGRPDTKIPVQLPTCGARSGSPQLAECVALWGEPEQVVNGMKERRKQWHEGEKRNNLHGLLTCVACICTSSPDLRCLSS